MSCWFWNHKFLYHGCILRKCNKCNKCQKAYYDFVLGMFWVDVSNEVFLKLVGIYNENTEIERLQSLLDKNNEDNKRREKLKRLREEVKGLDK